MVLHLTDKGATPWCPLNECRAHAVARAAHIRRPTPRRRLPPSCFSSSNPSSLLSTTLRPVRSHRIGGCRRCCAAFSFFVRRLLLAGFAAVSGALAAGAGAVAGVPAVADVDAVPADVVADVVVDVVAAGFDGFTPFGGVDAPPIVAVFLEMPDRLRAEALDAIREIVRVLNGPFLVRSSMIAFDFTAETLHGFERGSAVLTSTAAARPAASDSDSATNSISSFSAWQRLLVLTDEWLLQRTAA